MARSSGEVMPAVTAAVREAIMKFTFSNYGLDEVDILKEDEGASDWIDDLASEIAVAVDNTGVLE